ncbi:hypothetical protein D5086_014357 [Populus alba]|uniref:Uncharacterized protein n=1 Tax=Populus alba TaxID=43335 RepID=A0ACC4BZ53_POPAL
MAIHTLRDCNWADSTVWLEEFGSFLAPQFFVGKIDDWLCMQEYLCSGCSGIVSATLHYPGLASFGFSTVLSSLLSRPLMEEVIVTCGGLPGIMVAELQVIRPSSSCSGLVHVLREGNSGAADMLWPSFT